MKIICIPIDEDRGLLSPVARRFCDAAIFLLVETDALTWRAIKNVRSDGCDPRVLLRGAMVDLFILSASGPGSGDPPPLDAPIFRTPAGTVSDAIAAYIAGRLPSHGAATP